MISAKVSGLRLFISHVFVVSLRRPKDSGDCIARRNGGGGCEGGEVDALFFYHQRTFVHARVDRPDVFAKDANEEELDGTEEKDADHYRSDSDGEVLPEQQLVNQVAQAYQEAQDRSAKSQHGRQAQRDLGETRDSEHRQVVKRVEVVLGKAALAGGLHERDLGDRKSEIA